MFIIAIVFTGVTVAGSAYLLSSALQKVKDDCNQDLLDAKEKEIQLLMQRNNQLSRELSKYAAVHSSEKTYDCDAINLDGLWKKNLTERR